MANDRLVVPTQQRVTRLALVQHGQQLAVVVAVDVPSELVSGALGAAHQYAHLAGSLEECLDQSFCARRVVLPRWGRVTPQWSAALRPCT